MIRTGSKFIYLLLFLFLVLIAGTRNIDVGTDTSAYYRIFEFIASDGGWFRVSYYEPFYVFINQLVAKLGGAAPEIIMLTVVITVANLFLFFRKTSLFPVLSVLLYISVFGYLTLFNGVRQAIAVSFFVWFVYFLYHKNYWWSLVFGLAAIVFHYTAGIAIFVFLLFRFLNPAVIIFLYILSLPFLFSPTFSSALISSLLQSLLVFVPDKYAYYLLGVGDFSGLALKDFINQIIFLLSFYFLFYKPRYSHGFARYIFYAAILSVLFYNFFYYVKFLDRLALYFYIFNVLAIPVFLSSLKGAYVKLLSYALVGTFALLLLARSIINGSNGITPYSSWLF